MLEELISCKKPDHHKKIAISYIRGVISCKKLDHHKTNLPYIKAALKILIKQTCLGNDIIGLPYK